MPEPREILEAVLAVAMRHDSLTISRDGRELDRFLALYRSDLVVGCVAKRLQFAPDGQCRTLEAVKKSSRFVSFPPGQVKLPLRERQEILEGAEERYGPLWPPIRLFGELIFREFWYNDLVRELQRPRPRRN